jgi:hypothetical protein
MKLYTMYLFVLIWVTECFAKDMGAIVITCDGLGTTYSE